MKIALDYLVLSVGQMCNLKCKHCANFAPYALPEMRRYPVESIIADFEALFKVVGKINLLQIQGGESFAYSDLHKLTSYLSACKEVGNIVIATNGTITPADELMNNLSINNIKLRISNYPQNRSNIERLVTKAQAYRVELQLYGFASKQSLWYDCGGLDTPRENDDNVVTARFNKCAFKGCLTMENGELHRCSRAPNAHILQGFEQLPPPMIMFTSAIIRS